MISGSTLFFSWAISLLGNFSRWLLDQTNPWVPQEKYWEGWKLRIITTTQSPDFPCWSAPHEEEKTWDQKLYTFHQILAEVIVGWIFWQSKLLWGLFNKMSCFLHPVNLAVMQVIRCQRLLIPGNLPTPEREDCQITIALLFLFQSLAWLRSTMYLAKGIFGRPYQDEERLRPLLGIAVLVVMATYSVIHSSGPAECARLSDSIAGKWKSG